MKAVPCEHNDMTVLGILSGMSSTPKTVMKEQRIGGRDLHRPGDIYHHDFTNGKPAFFDITVRNSLQASYIVAAATSAGAAALTGEMEKDAYHDETVAAAGGEFSSLALKTLRCWTPSCLKDSTNYRVEDYHL